MMGTPLLIARSTSRSICGEMLAFAGKDQDHRARLANGLNDRLAQPTPGTMLRGAIQQRTPCRSKTSHAA